ncbi:MAG TPA: hypothetical protein PLR71_08440 [Deltaproteobacteria bacterium]|nr:hypothetical protein [Deltaproteobacteria bacterium]HQI81574.1 hypothetical protein [Deltaproteobacteria bacterium]
MRRAILCVCMLMGVVPSIAHTQQIHIDVEAGEFRKMKVAMPSYAGPPDMAASVWTVCARDFAITWLFDVISPQSYINPGPTGEIQPGTLKDWALIGADYVVTATISRQGPRGIFRVQMVEVATGILVESTTYTSGEQTMYLAVHAFMDHLLKEKFGLGPLFSSKIACIKKVNGAKQLHVMWCDGTGATTIRGGGSLVLNPAWSPDGRKIALVSYYRNNPDLYVFDTLTYQLRLVSGARGLNTSPAFDPSGSRIAFTSSADGNPEIHLVNADGTGRTRLTNSWATDTSPAFSPDGKSLAFCSSRAGNPQIFLLDLASRNVQRLTFEGKYNTEPAFSPRGDLVAFSYLTEGGRYAIALVRPDGSQFRVLKGSGRGDETPSFSPDGRLIAYASSDGNINVMDLTGSSSVAITTGGGYSEPAWSPVIR